MNEQTNTQNICPFCGGPGYHAGGCQKAVTELNSSNKAFNETELKVSLYATAARVIALHLERFCDESLPYDQMIADAARKAGADLKRLEEQLDVIENQRAKEWNSLCELELNNLRSLKDDLEGYLRAVMEHIAPMLKLYEPNLPEHPVIAAIRDYLDKP